MLSKSNYQKAVDFIKIRARPVDRALYEFLLELGR